MAGEVIPLRPVGQTEASDAESGTAGAPAGTPMAEAERPALPAPAVKAEPDHAALLRARFLADTEGEYPALRTGPGLARLREGLGLSLSDISAATMIRQDFLRHLEMMTIKEIPTTYIPMYLATYARQLGLEPATVVSRYELQCGALSEAPDIQIDTTPRARLRQQVKWVTAAAAVFVISGVVLIFAIQLFARRGDELADAVIDEPVAGAPAVNGGRDALIDPAALARIDAQAALPLELVALRRSWIEVRGADGTVFRDRVVAPGERLGVRVGAGWTVSARDGGAFAWHVGDVVIGPLGPDGAPVYAASVDAAAAEAQARVAPLTAAYGTTVPNR